MILFGYEPSTFEADGELPELGISVISDISAAVTSETTSATFKSIPQTIHEFLQLFCKVDSILFTKSCFSEISLIFEGRKKFYYVIHTAPVSAS